MIPSLIQHAAGPARVRSPARSRVPVLLVAVLLLATPAGAQETHLTIYGQGPAYVSEQRTLEPVEGWGEIDLEPGQWLPGTVVVTPAREGGAAILETRVLEERGLGPLPLLSYYRGKEIVLRTEGKTWYGTLESADEHGAAVRVEDDLVWVPAERWEGIDLPGFREIEYRSPAVRFRTDESGPLEVDLSYMTMGLGWSAAYRAILPEKGERLAWESAAVISNGSGRGYRAAGIVLVAGELLRSGVPTPSRALMRSGGLAQGTARAQSLSVLPAEEPLGEAHLYTLPASYDLEPDEIKRVPLYELARVTFRREYRYLGQHDGRRVRSLVLFENDEASGLGKPLPAGWVTFFESDAQGRLRPMGEALLRDLARNEDAELLQGFAFDLAGKRTVLERTQLSRTSSRERVRIEVSNRKDEEIEILVQEQLRGNWKIVSETLEGEKKSASLLEYRVSLAADETKTLEYVVEFVS